MDSRDVLLAPPTPERVEDALQLIGQLLERDVAYVYHRGYHFSFGAGKSVALTPETAGRFRLDACLWTRPVATLWVLADSDDDRLAGAISSLVEVVHDGSGSTA